MIAAINGFALGGGCEMSVACDFRLMADHAKIGVPEVRIGALAGAGGVQKLHRLVGRGKALEWILLGSHVTAAEALAHGLVTAIHPAEDLLPAAIELAGRFRLLGPRAVSQSKMAVRLCGDTDLTTARRIGLEALAMLIDGPEWQEGMNAFMEKREPRFPPLAVVGQTRRQEGNRPEVGKRRVACTRFVYVSNRPASWTVNAERNQARGGREPRAGPQAAWRASSATVP